MRKDWKIESKRYDEIILSCPVSDDEVEFVVICEDDAGEIWTVYNFYVDMDMVEDCDGYENNFDPDYNPSTQEIIIDCVLNETKYFVSSETEFEEFPFKTLAVVNAEKYAEMDLSDFYESCHIGDVQDWISDEWYLSIDARDLLDRIVEYIQYGTFDDRTEEFCWWLYAIMSEEQIESVKNLDIEW